MSKRSKAPFVSATALIIVGALIFVGTLAALNFDISKLSTQKFETNTYEINESFDKISIDTDEAEIIFAPSNDGVSKVECRENQKIKHSVNVKNGTLKIDVTDARKWYDCFNISFESSRVTVYLSKADYQSLSVAICTGRVEIPSTYSFDELMISSDISYVVCRANVSNRARITTITGSITLADCNAEIVELTAETGDIDVSSANGGAMNVSTDNGEITLNQVKADALSLKSETGAVTLKNTVAAKSINIENDMGDVKLKDSDGANISITTQTGDVVGTLLSDKIFLASTATGNVQVPKTSVGGRCEITTDTGDIEIDISDNS